MWYALIDKVKPQLVKQPKILLPDISGNNVIFIDKGLFYPAHNIYYIVGKTIDDLEVLAAILMSRFVKGQIESLSNKMNGGLPRWQSQNIRKLRIPIITDVSPLLRSKLIEAYYRQSFRDIDIIVEDIVNLQSANKQINEKNVIPQSLFD